MNSIERRLAKYEASLGRSVRDLSFRAPEQKFATPNFDQAVPELRMIVTPWMVDAAGNHYRLVFAAGTKIEDVGYCATSSSEKLISAQIYPVAGHSTQQ